MDYVCAGSEYGVDSAAELADQLGLPHHGRDAQLARRDKAAMHLQLTRHEIDSLDTHVADSISSLEQIVDRLHNAKYVVKPRDSAGSDGCTIVGREDVLAAGTAIWGKANLMGQTNHEVLVQEYAEGPQYIVNTVSHERTHWLTDMYAERIDEIAGLPTVRHTDSITTLGETEQVLVDYVFQCLDALEIRDGAAHTEVRLTERGPVLIEVNSRIMGPCLLPDPYMLAFGYSQQHILTEKILRPAEFENRLSSAYSPSQTLVKVFLRSHKPGVLNAIPGLRVMRRLPHFHSVAWMPPVGRELQDLTLTTGYMGVAFFVGENKAEVMNSVEAVHELEDRGLFFDVTSGLAG
ncbi:ATP-grasp domain-containing protein [Brevibacterium antiquum]|uniref:ATP-grasp domain-containing protein n=1 Tax=Brevibacterium antiquum TaxID=234835 RepID=UPI0018DFAA4C